MHEIYLLAIMFNASRRHSAAPARDQRLRDEQAFYDRHGGGRWPRFRMFGGLAPGLPVVVVAVGLLLGVACLLVR